jgi:hypothetical protein
MLYSFTVYLIFMSMDIIGHEQLYFGKNYINSRKI